MATYSSEQVNINAPAEIVFDRLNNLEGLGTLLMNAPVDSLPDDKRAMLDQVQVTADTITFPGGPVGNITLRKEETVRPEIIRLVGDGTPVPLSLSLRIRPENEIACSARVDIDIQIPAMLKPMVNGPLQKMADQFATMLRSIPFA